MDLLLYDGRKLTKSVFDAARDDNKPVLVHYSVTLREVKKQDLRRFH